MDFFFNPDGVAIIGATNNPLKGGYHILNNTLAGYTGAVYPVNPRYESILGTQCYPDIESIPHPFDLAVYFIPARFLPDTIDACATKGVKGMIIESAGFAEAGEDGKQLQEECLEHAARHHIRLWGPNCMGLLDGHSRNVFSFMYTDEWKTLMKPGNVSMIVQSGMLSATFLMMILERGGMGMSKMCSIGNKCDVSETELLEYLIRDPLTDVIGLYVESISQPRRFMNLCRASRKPVIVLKGGRSPSGAYAAMSHTASLAGDYTIMAGAFEQAGVLPVFGVHELVDLLRGFSKTKCCRVKGGTAVVTFSGGGGIVTADLLNDFGLPLARLSDETLKSLRTIFPPWMEPSNPVDLWPSVEQNGMERVYTEAIAAIMQDKNVDSLILHLFSERMQSEWFRPLAEFKDTLGKSVTAWVTGTGARFHEFRGELEDMGIPVFEEMKRGVEFLAAVKKRFRTHPQCCG